MFKKLNRINPADGFGVSRNKQAPPLFFRDVLWSLALIFNYLSTRHVDVDVFCNNNVRSFQGDSGD